MGPKESPPHTMGLVGSERARRFETLVCMFRHRKMEIDRVCIAFDQFHYSQVQFPSPRIPGTPLFYYTFPVRPDTQADHTLKFDGKTTCQNNVAHFFQNMYQQPLCQRTQWCMLRQSRTQRQGTSTFFFFSFDENSEKKKMLEHFLPESNLAAYAQCNSTTCQDTRLFYLQSKTWSFHEARNQTKLREIHSLKLDSEQTSMILDHNNIKRLDVRAVVDDASVWICSNRLQWLRIEQICASTTVNVGLLPDSLRELQWLCSEPLPPLPHGLLRLHCKSIQCTLPYDLQELYSDCNLEFELPSDLRILDIDFSEFKSFPSTLRELYFGKSCTHLCAVLPPHLLKLDMGNIGVLGTLPDSLQFLRMCTSFNHPIQAGTFPDGLTGLWLSDAFTFPLGVGILPCRLQHLRFGDQFNQTLQKDVLPSTLLTLRFGFSFNQHIVTPFPQNVTRIRFGFRFNRKVHKDMFPASLLKLTFETFNQKLCYLPPNLQTLDLGSKFNQALLPNVFPASLTVLRLGRAFRKKLQYLPCHIQELRFHAAVNPKHLPPTVRLYIYNTDSSTSIYTAPPVNFDTQWELHKFMFDLGSLKKKELPVWFDL